MRQHKSRGQATAIGGVLFLLIAVLLTNFLYETFSIQRDMNLYDSLRAQERIYISDAFFGSQADYDTPNSTSFVTYTNSTMDTFENRTTGANPYTMITSNYTTGYTYPISNGEFTKDSTGWYFTRGYNETGVSGATGAYTTEVTGSVSGAGAVYMDFLFNPSTGSTANAILNWTRSVNIDLEAMGGASVVNQVLLNWGSKCTVYTNVQEVTISAVLVTPNGTNVVGAHNSITDIETNWVEKSENFTDAMISSGSGWYKVIVFLNVTLKHSASSMPEVQVVLDDVDLEIKFVNCVSDVEFIYEINQDPNAIVELEWLYTSHYNDSVIQTIYVIDQTTSRSILLSRAVASTIDVKLRFSISGNDIQKYVSQAGNIKFRIYAIASEPFHGNSSSPPLDILYEGTTDTIIVTMKNRGGVSVTVVSVWVIDFTGHHQYELDSNISPGETYRCQVAYNWTAGEYRFKLTTKKGTVMRYTTAAY